MVLKGDLGGVPVGLELALVGLFLRVADDNDDQHHQLLHKVRQDEDQLQPLNDGEPAVCVGVEDLTDRAVEFKLVMEQTRRGPGHFQRHVDE